MKTRKIKMSQLIVIKGSEVKLQKGEKNYITRQILAIMKTWRLIQEMPEHF